MKNDVVFGSFSKNQLDAAYNNAAAVPDSATRIADWTARSAILRASHPRELDQPYAPAPRTRFDVFRSGHSSAPLLIFIHGGWWQRNSKEIFAFLAAGPIAHGFDVALLGYTLAPFANLTQIAHEVRAGIDAVIAVQASRGLNAGPVILSGWSAGGHLTALTLDHPAISAGLAISGVFDLEPIRHSYINDALKLDAAEVRDLSPSLHPPCGKPFSVVYGANELPELQRQSRDYAVFCANQTAPVTCEALPGHDHFSILEELADPDGRLVARLTELLRHR